MTFVRGIWVDMKQKRLWPVALALVLALIAIPVVLAKPAPAPPKAPAPLASAGPAPLVASPASIRSNSDNGPVAGRFKDPFRQQHVPKATVTTTASKTTASTPSSGSSSAGSGGSPSGSNGGSTKPSNDVKVTKLKVRFGLATGTRAEREIIPGTPLPAVSNPLIVFLDFGGSNDSAGFLVSSDVVKTEGDGTCKPSKTVCSDLTLKPGDTRFFDLQNGEQYQLDVVSVVNG
jgi:hypothetical protein